MSADQDQTVNASTAAVDTTTQQAPAPAAASSTAAAPGMGGSLYVGELDPSVTEAMLFELFNMIGPVASIRICRDAMTRRSLGYGYVNYHVRADAERALETLNYTPIKGRACRIMWSQRDATVRKSGAANVFIKNLDPSIDNKMLHDTFMAFGEILSCKVATENGVSRGYGFVHYETLEAANNAIAAVNGMLLNEKKVFVGLHVPRKERESKAEEQRAKFTNVYVKNLDETVTTEDFRELFEKYGAITSAVVATDPETGDSKGFGFVNFEDHEAAAKAVEELHDSEFREKKLFVGRAQKKSEREDELKRQYEAAKLEKMSKYAGVNLYVKNLEESTDDEGLKQLFVEFGAITSAKVMRDERGVSRGFGFVCFSTAEEAERALAEMNGHVVATRPLYVALAQRKDVRRSQLEAQLQQRNQMRMTQAVGGPGAMYGAVPAGHAAPPLYFPGPGFPGAPRPMMYPGQPQQQPGMVPRGRWAPGANQPPMGPGGFVQPQQQFAQMGGRAPARPMVVPTGGVPGGRAMPPMGRPGMPAAAGAHTGPAPVAVTTIAPAADKSDATGGLTASALAAAEPAIQKQMLGEALYPAICETQPELAGKITGMLLEMDNGELLHLLESPPALEEKINEAVSVLKEHTSA